MNNEIVQSILSTYTALQTYLQTLNSRTVVWLLAIIRESLNVWLYYVTYVWCLMAISSCRPPLSSLAVLVIRHAQRPCAQAHRPLGWPVCPLNAPSSLPGATPEAQNGKTLSPARRWSFPVLACAIPY